MDYQNQKQKSSTPPGLAKKSILPVAGRLRILVSNSSCFTYFHIIFYIRLLKFKVTNVI